MDAFEKPQQGNPHQLTINQHIYPAKSIARFYNETKKINIYSFVANKAFITTASNDLFCAKRAWDQQAEVGYMKSIEDNFQMVCDLIITGILIKINDFEKDIINKFFALWNCRFHWNEQKIEDHKIVGALGLARNYSKDELEFFEKNGICGIRPDMTIPARHTNSGSILSNINQILPDLEDSEWGILKAMGGEFLVPDRCTNGRYIPISPTICLLAHSGNDLIDIDEVGYINKKAIESSKYYFFAKDLSKCPGYLQ